MNKLILKVIALSLTAMALLTSCEQQESLQQYYVDHEEADGFIMTSIPKTIVPIDKSKLSNESVEAYESINKINVLAMPLTADNKEMFAQETERLNKIFKNEKYELLMSHNSDGFKVKMMFDGTQDAIDEIIVYGNSPEMGLGVARVLGTDMNMARILNMMKELEGTNTSPAGIEMMMRGMGMPSQNMRIDAK
ncbi:DUF4252 domain-containing protein, partial [Nonlabens marinus]|uniref:DUF4252 domain-containing protein n=1 Tax=Nonlabens marinus S1-08 TaxID=1454201 RepID=W8W0C5_9FLAO